MEEKELSKGTKIKVAIITVLVILTTLAGITYAFFSIGVTGNEEASSVTVTAALLRLTYSDNLSLGGSSIYPGWSQSKTISVENTGSDTVYYKIIWRELLNQITNDELTISATCVSSSGTCPIISETPINTYLSQTSNIDIKNGIEIASGVTHTYTVTITFKEMSSAQNYNQGKSFYGTLNISEGQAQTQTASFESMGTDSDTGLPKVRSTSITSEEFLDITDEIDYASLISRYGNIYGYDNSKRILLAKHNLFVGKTQFIDFNTGTFEEFQILSTDPGYGLQGDIGYYGTVAFSGIDYWDASGSGIDSKYGTDDNYANNIYDADYIVAPNADFDNEDYSIAYYVEEYVNTLGLNNASGRLLTYLEADELSEFLYNNYGSYWLGSADGVCVFIWDGDLNTMGFEDTTNYGVRPVLIVNTSDIQ